MIDKLKNIPIWPTSIRLFHWVLVILIALLFLSTLKESWLIYHVYLGYACLGLIVWRVFYGFKGPYFLRFKGFLVAPKTLITHMWQLAQGKPPVYVGHPPPSGWWILFNLVLIIVICVSGILVFNGEERHAFGYQLSKAVGDLFRGLHETGSSLLLFMIGIHVLGVIIDSILHEVNLVKAMVTGKKPVPLPLAEEYEKQHHPFSWSILSLGALLGALALLGVSAFQQGTIQIPASPPLWKLSESGMLWKEECGACHQLYHPSLLPARSWNKMMVQLEDHFGEDASLDETDTQTILAFLTENSAERYNTEPAHKILRSLGDQDVPLAISDTPYWQYKHQGIAPEVFQHPTIRTKANCQACHQDADAGTFEDHLIAMPDLENLP